MRFSVSFIDVLENCESEEQAYDVLLDYLAECVKYKDVTAFDFTKLDNVGVRK